MTIKVRWTLYWFIMFVLFIALHAAIGVHLSYWRSSLIALIVVGFVELGNHRPS